MLKHGAHIRRHAHERSHELLFCYQGTGQADVHGKLYDVLPETMILIGRGLQHKVTNTGTSPTRLLCSSRPRDWKIGSARHRATARQTPAGGIGQPMSKSFRRNSVSSGLIRIKNRLPAPPFHNLSFCESDEGDRIAIQPDANRVYARKIYLIGPIEVFDEGR
jgi:hypothetical protein